MTQVKGVQETDTLSEVEREAAPFLGLIDELQEELQEELLDAKVDELQAGFGEAGEVEHADEHESAPILGLIDELQEELQEELQDAKAGEPEAGFGEAGEIQRGAAEEGSSGSMQMTGLGLLTVGLPAGLGCLALTLVLSARLLRRDRAATLLPRASLQSDALPAGIGVVTTSEVAMGGL